MKRFLLILLVLFVVLAAGLAIFAATFDADRYRPVVIKKMEEALGRPVKLEKLVLRLENGGSLELLGLEVPPSFQSRRVTAALAPLLSKRLAVSGEMKEGGTFRLNGSVRAWTPPLEGEFRLTAEGIRLANVNLLRDAFEQITIIPGLTDSLLARLPPEFAKKLEEKDTVFGPMDFRMTLKENALYFQDFTVSTDSFELAASGRYGLDGSVSFPARIFIQPDLSAALVRSVEELKFFLEGQRIMLPVRVEGNAQKPQVSPDLQALTERLLSGKGQDLVGEFLNKAFKRKEDPPSGG